MSRSVVLVHGAWHGAWCWALVMEALSAKGIDVVAIDLPGHGSDTGPLGDLHTDAERVRRVLDAQPGRDVILVGHSYGGAVITEAGEHPSVRHLVYLCAMALTASESCSSVAAGDPVAASISHDAPPDLSRAVIPDDGGMVTLEPTLAAECLYNQCDPETAAWAVGHLGPHPLTTLQQAPLAVAWMSKTSTYAVCADDLAIHPGLQRIMAARCTRTVEWDSDHSPFLSHPDLVIRLLEAEASHD
jgi:pimeloyl-ACP methyl ester carboxylesterase